MENIDKIKKVICTKCYNFGHTYTTKIMYGKCKLCNDNKPKCYCNIDIDHINYDHLFDITENFTKRVIFINPKFDKHFTFSGHFYLNENENNIRFSKSLCHLFSSFYTITNVSMKKLQNIEKLSIPIQFTKVSFYDDLKMVVDYDKIWFPFHDLHEAYCHDHKPEKIPYMDSIECTLCKQ